MKCFFFLCFGKGHWLRDTVAVVVTADGGAGVVAAWPEGGCGARATESSSRTVLFPCPIETPIPCSLACRNHPEKEEEEEEKGGRSSGGEDYGRNELGRQEGGREADGGWLADGGLQQARSLTQPSSVSGNAAAAAEVGERTRSASATALAVGLARMATAAAMSMSRQPRRGEREGGYVSTTIGGETTALGTAG